MSLDNAEKHVIMYVPHPSCLSQHQTNHRFARQLQRSRKYHSRCYDQYRGASQKDLKITCIESMEINITRIAIHVSLNPANVPSRYHRFGPIESYHALVSFADLLAQISCSPHPPCYPATKAPFSWQFHHYKMVLQMNNVWQ